VLLPDVTQIGEIGEVGGPAAMPSRTSLRFAGLGELGEHRLDLLGVERAEQAVERADEVLPPRRHQHAERRERARHLRHDDPGNENLFAMATACSGPAPPNAIIAVSRGSTPFFTDTARTASDIAASGDLHDAERRLLDAERVGPQSFSSMARFAAA
jgi:hypothetical protein